MRFVLAFLLAVLAPLSSIAQLAPDPVPERRVLVERDVDFYGSDLRALFDTSLDACRAACLADPACTAFTFNARSNSCFPKRGVERREPYAGAISATVVTRSDAALAVARQRAAELAFLGDAALREARDLAEDMAFDHPAGGADLEALLAGAEAARAAGDGLEALRRSGAAVALSDLSAHWRLHAEDARDLRLQDAGERRRLTARAVPAAVNAYLRAMGPADQGPALLTLASALERAGEGRDALRALRLADRVAPSDAVSAALDTAIARYGFRITESRVDSDSDEPRICATFSEPLDRAVDYRPYVQLPGVSFAVEATDSQLCIDGLSHGQRYRPTFRAGLPSASGEGMIRDATLSLYVRDRSARVRFPGRAYVLPKAAGARLPVVSVNLDEIELSLHRVAERNIQQLVADGLFGRPLNAWESDRFDADLAEEVWRGTTEVESALNSEVTTLLPMDEAVARIEPGLYALQARVPGSDPYDQPAATQWFLVSDLGIATMQGADGLHVFVRSLSTAAPLEGVAVQLVSRSNRVLTRVETDAEGHARIPEGDTTGRGGAAPALVTALTGPEDAPTDLVFLSLTEPEFDLSDRGVEGRAPAGPIDVFLATDRGAYRAGETLNATVLARNGENAALPGLPLTAIVTRPDGVEYARLTSDGGVAGGHVYSVPLGGTVPRGTWQLAIHADVGAPALAQVPFLVEDFLPERIDVSLDPPATAPFAGETAIAALRADWLFGAPGAGLAVEGDLVIRAAEEIEGWPGFAFGRQDARFEPLYASLPEDRTGPGGTLSLALPLPEAAQPGRPLEATATVRVSETSGRPVERATTFPLARDAAVIGVRAEFDGVVPEGAEARFQIVAVGPDGYAVPARARWTVNRVETRYQWYATNGQWNWEPVTRRVRVAGGTLNLGAEPLPLAVPVDWGQYEIVVEREDGPYAESSRAFDAGWYAPAEASAAPDRLEVSLDRAAYRPGDTATLRIVPRMPGKALVTVVSNRLIDMTAVEVGTDPVVVSLPVTDEWGAGAYVTATLVRPMEAEAGRNPARALGLAHAAVDPGPALLRAAFDIPSEVRPRGPLDVALRVEGLAAGETGWATIAAVDQGILNLTGHEPPDPAGHYFGQRRLGMALRDIYGRLIDGLNGTPGQLRSGGDVLAGLRSEAPPPTEDLLAVFSGPVEVGADGLARTTFELPSFNGSVRLMAVVWSDSGVGQADTSVLVRDPVVLTASVPRFLAPGDTGRLRLDLTRTEGGTGPVALSVAAEGVSLPIGAFPESLPLAEGETVSLAAPVTAGAAGTARLRVTLTLPDGTPLEKTLRLPVRSLDPVVSRTSRLTLAEDTTFIFSQDVFSGFRPGTGTATVALGPLARLDVPGLLTALDRMPWGCTEQVTSQALPLLYFGPVARALGLDEVERVDQRIAQAVDQVLARQNASGGFGLWGTYDGDLWLDAYVTDFLSRARAQGAAVPERAFEAALDGLANGVNTAPDFDARTNGGGTGLAYALHVLAREGRARIGDLRYYADARGTDFATPLAAAQLGAALAAYGEPDRAERMFARAAAQLLPTFAGDEDPVWRDDYGTDLRDAAAVLTLAAEAGSAVIDRETLTARIAAPGRDRSTQEAVWTLLAVNALAGPETGGGFLIDGTLASGPLVRLIEDDAATAPISITNGTGRETAVTVTAYGVPEVPPEPWGDGYRIDRAYYTLDGAPADPSTVAQGTRLVAVLTVTPFGRREARLMVTDPLPAGFEIDNPNLIRGGDLRALDWLDPASARHAEFREDRFLAAVDWRSADRFELAYVVRAVTPGTFHHPAASVEDMYRPQYRANGATGRITVTP